jgi:hypothetical protein
MTFSKCNYHVFKAVFYTCQDFQDLHDLALDTSSLLDMDGQKEEDEDEEARHQMDLSDIDTGGMDNVGLDLTDLENFILHDTASHRIFYGEPP